ncbi:DNA repair protein RecO [Psychrobacter alimentarius]|uniref:DNA repair protein RecO n=1 Tax=Psychrobacter alimentarius TaxID=261164 RepID=UPI003FD0AFBD
MRNEALVGYLLHQRPYQEKRALYYLFSQQHGVIHGVGKKGAPLFMPLQLFATGKRDLKTFSQIGIASNSPSQVKTMAEEEAVISSLPYENITGQHQYSALYLNEILWRLLPTEDPMPVLWQHYQNSLQQLRQPLSANELRLCLRQFEQHLFNELGFTLALTYDSVQNPIDAGSSYRFLPDVGLMPVLTNAAQAENLESSTSQSIFVGRDIIAMAQLGITETTLHQWSKLHRYLIDHLLDYQPLQSRLLWQQQQRYQ